MHIRHGHLRPIAKLGVFYLFFSIGAALISTIWSVYLNSFLHSSSLVGFLTSSFMILETLAFLFFIPFVEKINKGRTLIFSLAFFVVSYFMFSVFSNIWLVVVIGALIAIFSSLRIMLFGLIVRDKTKDENVSKNEGLMYSSLNVAWLIGPLAAGYLANLFGFKEVFLVASALTLISIILFRIFRLKDERKSRKRDKNILKIVSGFFKEKEKRLTYILNLSVNFWWAFIYIYMPLYIVDKGYSTTILGIFLAAVSIPLISFEYVFGKVAGKRGFKKLFFTGFIIVGILSIICFFIPYFYLILALLVLASVGMAMIEPTTEAYFMDVVKKSERERYYGVYTTSLNIGYLSASLIGAILLVFLPFKPLFLAFGIPMFLFAFFALKIKDSYEFEKAVKSGIVLEERENTKF